MSYGLVCLGCRRYLAVCECERPIPSHDAETPIRGFERGCTKGVAAQLAIEEKERLELDERYIGRAEWRRRLRKDGLL